MRDRRAEKNKGTRVEVYINSGHVVQDYESCETRKPLAGDGYKPYSLH